MKIIEDITLALTMNSRIEGPLKLEKGLFRIFLSAPEDPLPQFMGPAPELPGRGKDHPRYARLVYAFARFYKPDIIVEVGTNAGGTAVGSAKAIVENGKGRLICIDNGEGRPRVFPDITRENIIAAGLKDPDFDLICEDSQVALSKIARSLKQSVGIYLVDAAHTFETAFADIKNGLPMIKPGGFVLVHDVDSRLDLGGESSGEHSRPVRDAFHEIVREYNFNWCILKFIRKHLGIIKVNN